MTSIYTIPHSADTITNAITKVNATTTSGTLASNATLVQSNVIKSYVDTEIDNHISKTVNGTTTPGSILFTKFYETPETQIATGYTNQETFTHGLGTTPLHVQLFMKCVQNYNHFVAGDYVAPVYPYYGIRFNSANIYLEYYSPYWYVPDYDASGPSVTVAQDAFLEIYGGNATDRAAWRLVVRAFA